MAVDFCQLQKKESVHNCMKVIHYIFLFREASDLRGITTMKKFVKDSNTPVKNRA